jgi:hypothetical protein
MIRHGVIFASATALILLSGCVYDPYRAPYRTAYVTTEDWVAACARRYRSFDPESGTYLGYDGYRHACVL